ncbi:sensor histidine kinase [Heyndrickxia acidicola]|uniref:Heme sensor protein HssS n=1 Tax=Heyndrickxia acidicola TaxID=209389 RepID=A0ABU6MNW7_9BACI|nr:HAMP domain-containing sensor histidine kinase [Heyndrickxia acidicola]MED1205333.1 HAMP domain-containing sensor histidine kinase [Heyndrickxia acidicola]
MKTLYLRIFMTTIAVMMLSSLLSFFLSNAYYQYKLKPYNDKKLTRMAEDIQSFYEKNPEDHLDAYLKSVGNLGYQLYLVDSNGHSVYYGGPFRKRRLESNVIQSVLNGNVYHGIAHYPSKVFITGFFENDLKNTIGVPIKTKGQRYALFMRPNPELQIGELRIFLAVLLVLTFMLSVLFVIVSTRYLVHPITKLTEATKKIAAGKYDVQLHVNRRDEIGRLANDFSHMAKSLEQLEAMRQEFVSNVSHEIQSPLASIQGFSQTLQSDSLTEEERKYYLSIIEDESKRMSQLSKQLLTLASLDKEESILDKKTFDLTAQIKQILFMTEWRWREKDLAIDMELPSAYLYADENLLHQVWLNLITNSIKFSRQGGSISIGLSKEDDQCLVEITDTGIGMAEKDLPQIFNRFYKVDPSRKRNEAGTGLGLAIVKKIIELHNGQIHVKSTLGHGTTFSISLPRQ